LIHYPADIWQTSPFLWVFYIALAGAVFSVLYYPGQNGRIPLVPLDIKDDILFGIPVTIANKLHGNYYK
jgi:hypothetical protein